MSVSEKLSNEEALICEAIDREDERLWAIAAAIHGYAELGYQEVKSSELLVSALRQHGFSVEQGISGLATAFRASANESRHGPQIAFLAEYDALPGLGHACGHNLIGAAALGAAVGLVAVREGFPGGFHVFGTPAEEGVVEGAGGKVVMFRAGAFARMDAVLMVHPGEPFSGGGTCLARDNFGLTFRGRRPTPSEPKWDAVDSQDALMLTHAAINVLRQHVPPGVVIQWMIEKGGDNPNIIPVESNARLYVRAPTMDVVDSVVRRVMDCAQGAASATGGTVEYRRWALRYDETIPNTPINETFVRALRDAGVPDADISLMPPAPQTHSNDLGIISKHIPSMCGMIIVGPRGVKMHTVEATEATRSGIARKAMIAGAKAMALCAWRMARDPGMLLRAKQDLAFRTSC